jgi:hypothetical protein
LGIGFVLACILISFVGRLYTGHIKYKKELEEDVVYKKAVDEIKSAMNGSRRTFNSEKAAYVYMFLVIVFLWIPIPIALLISKVFILLKTKMKVDF